MRTLSLLALTGVSTLALAASSSASIVHIRVTGTVEWNMFPPGIGVFGGIPAGTPALMEMDVDSDVFTNSPFYPVRGYPTVPGSFRLTIGSSSCGLLPGPSNLAYWSIRNNDPGVDGFVFTSTVDYADEVLLDMGVTGYGITFLRTFNGATPGHPDPTLTSLDILGAQGDWGFENLSVYDFTIQRGEFSTPLGIIYETLSIHVVGAACNLADLTDIGDTGAGPDSQLTVDDVIAFFNAFADSTGCPGTAPCNVADVTGIGGPPEAADGQLTVDDVIAFVNAFSDGC